jgi:hypothetical protein
VDMLTCSCCRTCAVNNLSLSCSNMCVLSHALLPAHSC